jgi:glycosyltransferase involved in cell wall biosynthesis
MAATPQRETRHDIDVLHPRYALPPKVGMTVAPLLLALGARAALRRVRDEGFDFDVIDAHYCYPDGVAAALLSKWFERPLTITARGSDINLIARFPLPRRLMRWAAQQASACIGVSAALVEAMRDAGLPGDRLLTLRNGVDLSRFRPLDPATARTGLGLQGSPLLLSVGNLIPLKGHELCISALALLRRDHPQARLVIVGAGPERERLRAQAAGLRVGDAVLLAGTVSHEALANWYSAADLLLLASSREGWPNVLLEAMACGTPALATRVGGTREIITCPAAGLLLAERSAEAIAAAVTMALARPPDRAAVRLHAEQFGWEPTSRAQIDLFGRLAQRMEASHA